ncbi:MAG TPA: hypothetical protein PK830_04475 [Candidatus Atribacteria bacterium]|nr:hypothetical protein [Candidatus Atribacteria bacterium]
MKRTVYNRSLSSKPGVFMIRRDLFPEEAHPQPDLQPVYGGTAPVSQKAAPFDDKAGSNVQAAHRRAPKPYTQDPVILILLIFGGLLFWPRLRVGSKEAELDIQTSVSDAIDNPVSLKILHDICPYLDERERDVVFTITGIVEVLRTIQELLDHRYHMRQHSKVMAAPVDPVSRRIGIVKALQPYIPEVGKKTVDNMLKIYDTINELGRGIEKYRSGGAAISDAAEIILPLLPDDYRRKAGRIIKAVKMAEAMTLADEADMAGREDEYKKQAEKADKVERMVEALKPMLSDEQKGSIELLMKMARLLSEPNEEQNIE